MKKFVFSLQKVLSLREFEENTAKIELGKAISETERIKQELSEVAAQKVENSKRRSGQTDVFILQAIENYINRLDLRKEELLEELTEAELVVEQKRSVFAEAMKKRKVIDKLREKKERDFRLDSLKTEESLIDDMNSATEERRKSQSEKSQSD